MHLAIFIQTIFASVAWSCTTDSTRSDLRLGNTDFILVRKHETWMSAINHCHNIGRTLAIFQTMPVANTVIDLIQSISEPYSESQESGLRQCDLSMHTRYWIGLSDYSENGRWQWMHYGYDLTYDLWFKNQPDHIGQSEDHCVALWNPNWFLGQKHTYNDDDCNQKYYFICGYEKSITNSDNNTTDEVITLAPAPLPTTISDVEPASSQPLPIVEETTPVIIIETPVPTETPTTTTTTEKLVGRTNEATPKPFPQHHLHHKKPQHISPPVTSPPPPVVSPPSQVTSSPPKAAPPPPPVFAKFTARVSKEKRGKIKSKDRGNRGG